jgi:membrane protease YdiL (CAAX protease family)
MRPHSKTIPLYVLIAFVWSWLCWVPDAMMDQGIELPATLARLSNAIVDYGAWGPLVAALVVSAWAGGKAGLRAFVGRMLNFRFGLRWYLVAILLYPALIAASMAVAVALGDPLPEMPMLAQPLVVPIIFLVIFFTAGPLQEEAGWRGTVQEDFQSRFHPLVASLLVGLMWGLWHLPLFFMEREDIYYQRPIWGLIISTMLASVLFAWVYNSTGGSILAAMLMHASFNWAHVSIPTLDSDRAALTLLILQVIVIAGVWYRWRDLGLEHNPGAAADSS